jgi:Fe2+ transport system protein FeoA
MAPSASPSTSASLLSAPLGERRTVVAAMGAARDELAREGLLPGTRITVISRAPLGGPLVIEVGRARVAISADVGAQVWTGGDDGAEARA